MKFGHLDKNSFHDGSLRPLANLVAENENVSFKEKIGTAGT